MSKIFWKDWEVTIRKRIADLPKDDQEYSVIEGFVTVHYDREEATTVFSFVEKHMTHLINIFTRKESATPAAPGYIPTVAILGNKDKQLRFIPLYALISQKELGLE